uniref:Replication-associated protein ORF2/G2P domain-containing protein n=1 Tax=uncultured prokaryote TaxID=198431 RepID=A0A0H5QH00_9ZZZZ|nr:hypothetical protein [uncultured prokaryote]
MHRIIHGTLYARQPQPCGHTVRIHDLGHGHVEVTGSPRFIWEEVAPLSPLALADFEAARQSSLAGGELPVPERELRDRANRERATRRARTCVRRLAKSKGLTVLLTLTYRENMTDRERMQRDFDVFMKRLRRVSPGVQYICVFERQRRGAWHAHIAVQRVLPWYLHKGLMVRSYDLLRSLWRAVVGADNGNVDVSRNKRVNRSSAKLASYLSKYIGKTFDQADKHVNSYSASGRALPAAAVFQTVGHAGQVFELVADLLGPEMASSELYTALLDGGGVYCCLSPPERPKRP